MVINPIIGFYIYIPIIRIPIKGGMTIPNIATFDHGTNRGYPNHLLIRMILQVHLQSSFVFQLEDVTHMAI